MSDWVDPMLPVGLARRAGRLLVDGVDVATLADCYGTPLYVYSLSHVRAQYAALSKAFAALAPTICYAIKANDVHAILLALAELGAGADVVSGGEYARARRAGIPAERIVFSGVGKRHDEIATALAGGVRSLNLESPAEAEAVATVAREMGVRAPVSVRVNPDVDAKTHPHIATGLKSSKFGVAIEVAPALYRDLASRPEFHVVGVACHIGSQLTDIAPILAALARVLTLVDKLQAEGIVLEHLDLGGGLGIRYTPTGAEPDLDALAAGVAAQLRGRGLKLVLEPGRFLLGNAGILVTEVLYRKTAATPLAVVDAAMNDLLRPALYGATHWVLPLLAAPAAGPLDLVGPVCESADVLARGAMLPDLAAGDRVALLGAGAYGSVMASSYNTRPRPAEVVVDAGRYALARPRETLDAVLGRDVIALEWRT